MPNWVNFADIRKRVSIEDVLLRYYRITNLKRDGTKLSGPCPVHDGESPRSFHVELDKNIWHCFSKCQGGGNQLDLVAKKENISIRDAALRLQTFFSVEGKERTEPVMHKGKESAPESIHRRENESELRKESSLVKQKE